MVAILSMHSRGTSPNKARRPVCGIRKGMDIITANSSTSPQSMMFSFFIIFERYSSYKDMNYFTTFVSYVDRYA